MHKEILKLEIRVEVTVRKLFRKANDTAAMVVDVYDKAEAYNNIVDALIRVGNLSGAREAAALTPDLYPELSSLGRESAYSELGMAQARAGNFNLAFEALNLIDDGDDMMRLPVLEEIVKAQVTVGNLDGASETVTLMAGTGEHDAYDFYRTGACRVIFMAQIEAGDIAGAVETASLVKVQEAKAEVYQSIAKVYMEAGDLDGALETAALIDETYRRGFAYEDIAEVQVAAGDIDVAMETIALITDNIWALVRPCNTVVEARIAAGDMEAAWDAVGDLSEGSKELDPWDFPYTTIAIAYAEAGDIHAAIDTAGYGVTNLRYLAMIDSAISKAMFRRGDFAGALETAASIDDTDWKDSAYEYIATEGDITCIRKMASLIPDGIYKAKAYYHIVELQLEAGDIDGARETAALIDGDYSEKAEAYWRVQLQIKAGDMAGAKETAALFEEVKSWVTFAQEYRGEPSLNNLPEFLKSLTTRESVDVAKALADASVKLTEALKEIQGNDVKWQGNRAGSAP